MIPLLHIHKEVHNHVTLMYVCVVCLWVTSYVLHSNTSLYCNVNCSWTRIWKQCFLLMMMLGSLYHAERTCESDTILTEDYLPTYYTTPCSEGSPSVIHHLLSRPCFAWMVANAQPLSTSSCCDQSVTWHFLSPAPPISPPLCPFLSVDRPPSQAGTRG